MPTFEESPYRATRRLLTGHFRETSGYRAFREHGVADWLLIHTVGGRGRFGHAGGELIAEAGDWVLLRPGTRHDYGVEAELQRWELVWAHFQPRAEWLDWLAWPAVADGLLHLHIEGDHITTRFLEVHRLLDSQHRRSEALAMNALEALLLACDAHNPHAKARPLDRRIQHALDFLDQNLTEKLLIDDVAEAVGLSPSRLAHLFREETGETVQGHLETRRMQLAADLLRRTGFPIKQIAGQCGFESQFYFSQRFRRFSGQSPLAFRSKI